LYDAFDLPGGSVGLVIADVCDKGVGAALFMALFRSLIRIFSGQTTLAGLACSVEDSNPKAVETGVALSETNALKAIQLTNDYIVQNHEELAMFATVFFGVLDPKTGALTYINGGHDPLYILNPSGGVRQKLGPTGPAVGIRPDATLEIQRARLNPGEILFGYTDGVTEASAKDGKFFKEKKLLTQLKTGSASAPQLLDKISTEVKNHIGGAEQFDDITMLAVRRLPAWPV
jgi:sigma-B regulation protein RsbU (phosphoserine phosphatase)